VQLFSSQVFGSSRKFAYKFNSILSGLTNLSMLEGLVDAPVVFTMGRVKIILDAVIGPSRQLFRDICPLISKQFMQFEDLLLFLFTDWVFLYVRIQMVVPSKESSA
jgi:hypothetical protein